MLAAIALAPLLELICVNDSIEDVHYPRRIALLANRLWHWLRPNSRRGSKRNIAAHYDLGNDFYRRWLDPSMTYSSAVFPAPSADLIDAQHHKYRLICDKLALSPGQRVLEIGCGWGGFATFAAREFVAHVTAITVSKEQLAYAQARIQREGLGERVEARFIDYRDLTRTLDRIASIEMFEAVGEKYWPAFFGKMRETLAPGGRAALQIITIADTWFERTGAASISSSAIAKLRSLIEADGGARALLGRLRESAKRLLEAPPVEFKIEGPRLLAQSRRCLPAGLPADTPLPARG